MRGDEEFGEEATWKPNNHVLALDIEGVAHGLDRQEESADDADEDLNAAPDNTEEGEQFHLPLPENILVQIFS